MKLKSFIVFIFLILFIRANSQANLLNARVPQDVGQLNEQQILANNQDPLKYGYVDDRDVLWSKTVWEIIDLDERINFPFYYPTQIENLGEDRRSLWHILTDAIRPDTQVTALNTLNKARDYTGLVNTSSNMTNQELREALRLLLELWEEQGQEACEALLAAVSEEN